MRSLSFKSVLAAALLACAMASTPLVHTASAMPNFARKYGLGCGSCHDVVPKLNEFGWKFRAAGYRMPDEIGKAKPTMNLGDYFAGRINFSINQASATAATPGSQSINNFNIAFTGGSIYALFGALTPNISSESELGFSTSGTLSVSTASVGYYSGDENNWFVGRIGIINTLQGYGGSDRGWSGSPLMNSAYPISLYSYEQGDKTKPAYTGLTGSNMGIDLGYVFGQATVHAEALSGYTYASGKPSAALAGKPMGTGAGQAPSANSFDYMFWANYILTDDGGGISAAYYIGQADINTNTTANTSNVDSLFWQNKFTRYAIYASYPIPVVKALLLAGYEGGKDNSWALKTFVYGPDISSHGYFGELDYPITDLVGVGARYDAVTPDNSHTNNNITVITAYCDYNFGDGFAVTGSYSVKNTDTPASNGVDLLGTAKNNAFSLKVSWFQ